MFSLIAGFWKYFFSKPNTHILLIGLDNAGKTTILEKIKFMYGKGPVIPPDRIPPTIGMNLAKINYQNNQVIIWDLGGQVKIRKIWENYYGEANAVVFVIDSCDVNRFQEAKLSFDSVCDHETLSKVPIITFANKQDLPDAVSLSDLAITFRAHNDNVNHKVFSVSGLTGDGLSEAIPYIVTEALKNARLKQK